MDIYLIAIIGIVFVTPVVYVIFRIIQDKRTDNEQNKFKKIHKTQLICLNCGHQFIAEKKCNWSGFRLGKCPECGKLVENQLTPGDRNSFIILSLMFIFVFRLFTLIVFPFAVWTLYMNYKFGKQEKEILEKRQSSTNQGEA